jgi:hypothetical protein
MLLYIYNSSSSASIEAHHSRQMDRTFTSQYPNINSNGRSAILRLLRLQILGIPRRGCLNEGHTDVPPAASRPPPPPLQRFCCDLLQSVLQHRRVRKVDGVLRIGLFLFSKYWALVYIDTELYRMQL